MQIIFTGKADENFQDIITKSFQTVENKVNNLIKNRPTNIKCVVPYYLIVELSTRLKTSGGNATYHNNTIKLNYRLLNDNKDHIEQTFIHELSHIVSNLTNSNGRGHCDTWKRTMSMLGKSPDRCHDMDTSKLRSKKKRHIYNCVNYNCSSTYQVSSRKHNIIQNQSSKYWCSKCKSNIKYEETITI